MHDILNIAEPFVWILIIVYNFSEVKMKCKLCGFRCINVSEFVKHCKTTHSTKSGFTQLPCDRCDLVLHSRTRFYSHYQEHIKNNVPQNETNMIVQSKALFCSHCNDKYSSYEAFKTHIRKVYKENEK